MKRLWILMLIFSLAGFVLASCGDDDDPADGGTGDNDDDNADDDSDDDAADDDATDDDDTPGSWEGIGIEEASAPDQYTVEVVLTGDPGQTLAEDLNAYAINSDHGALKLEEAAWDGDDLTVTLTTAKQKLGITYTLTIDTGAKANPQADFLSADTATFWAYNFGTGGQYEVNTYRAGIGQTCAVYIEDGYLAADVNESIDAFDTNIYPTLTNLLTAAPDLDGNDRITILGLNGEGYYGGYFSPINAYTDEQAMDWWGIHSNEMELIHINVLYGSLMPEHVIPHEFQHLLYQEEHKYAWEHWEYHNEGLSECAVHIVNGSNDGAVASYLADYDGLIGAGLSLVHWNYGLYENYVQAYLFWSYIASRLNGIETYVDIFELEDGNPDEVDDFLQTELASDFTAVHFENLIANWVQAETGVYGFDDFLSFDAHMAPTVASGTTSVDLEPYAGTFFPLTETEVNYPGTEGEHIVYAGIDTADTVDLAEPFTVDGGVLLVYNTHWEYDSSPEEHSGPDIEAAKMARALPPRDVPLSPAWFDPPPIHPERMEKVEQWKQNMEKMGLAGW